MFSASPGSALVLYVDVYKVISKHLFFWAVQFRKGYMESCVAVVGTTGCLNQTRS